MGLQLMTALLLCIASCAAGQWTSWSACTMTQKNGCMKRRTGQSGRWGTWSCPSSDCDGSCPDSYKKCQMWANIGECEKNKAWMNKNCCQACKNGACYDINVKCQSWANGGYCTTSMQSECCQACKGVQCVDNRKDCSKYAKLGYCKKAGYAWWQQKCCGSCKAVSENKGSEGGSRSGSGVGGKKKNSGSSSGVGSKKQNGGDPASELAKACLKIHNEERAKHNNTNPLTYDATLGAAAQAWAYYNARIDRMKHSTEKGRNYGGENLAYRSKWHEVNGEWVEGQTDAEAVIDSVQRWYAEIKNWKSCKNYGYVLHFTQIVWRATTKLGCGVARTGEKVFVAARYMVTGNRGGQYCANVGSLV